MEKRKKNDRCQYWIERRQRQFHTFMFHSQCVNHNRFIHHFFPKKCLILFELFLNTVISWHFIHLITAITESLTNCSLSIFHAIWLKFKCAAQSMLVFNVACLSSLTACSICDNGMMVLLFNGFCCPMCLFPNDFLAFVWNCVIYLNLYDGYLFSGMFLACACVRACVHVM